jgi:hypothetical protein
MIAAHGRRRDRFRGRPPGERKQLMRRSSIAPEAERKLVQRALACEREIFARRVAPLLKRLEELDRIKRGPNLRLVTSAPRAKKPAPG